MPGQTEPRSHSLMTLHFSKAAADIETCLPVSEAGLTEEGGRPLTQRSKDLIKKRL